MESKNENKTLIVLAVHKRSFFRRSLLPYFVPFPFLFFHSFLFPAFIFSLLLFYMIKLDFLLSYLFDHYSKKGYMSGGTI